MKRNISLMLALTTILTVASFSNATAQKKKLYNPSLDGKEQLLKATSLAQAGNKNILVQVGGNWCPWCIKFDKFLNFNTELSSIVDKNYVTVHLNYSKKNKNWRALEQLGFPQRFGFPVFVILDKNGNRIHTQDSGYLEKGDGYDVNKVKRFLTNWTPKATQKSSYSKK